MTDSNTLPAPLVPAYLDLSKFQDMPLGVQRLREARMFSAIPPEAALVNIILWCASWHQVPAGSLPDDDVDLANLAGYGRFGLDKWREARSAGALYGFVKCSDGRLYHRVVCEVALVAWRRKREYEYVKFRDALGKHNRKVGDDSPEYRPLPSFEAWDAAEMAKLSAGTPARSAGKPAISAAQSPLKPPEPVQSPPTSAGTSPPSERDPPEVSEIPGDFRTNRTEQNGTEQNGTEQNGTEHLSPGRPPAVRHALDPGTATARGEMAGALRKLGVQVASHNPTLHEWLRDGFTTAQMVEAVEIARAHKPAPEPIAAGYLDKVARTQRTQRTAPGKRTFDGTVTAAEHAAAQKAIFGGTTS